MMDAHAHVSNTDYGNIELLIRELDNADIEKCVVVPGGMVDVRKMTLYVTGALEPNPSIPNDCVYDAIQKYPNRINGFVCVNPLDEEQAWVTFKDGIHHGCVGVKLSPLTHKFSFGGDTLEALADECGKRHFPIYSHSLFHPGVSTSKYGQLARRHPKTNFILGHMGFGPLDVLAIELAATLPNFYLETSLACSLAIVEAIKKAGPEKLIFGSEFPMSTPGIQKLMLKELHLDQEEKIFSENIRRLLP